ncbi:MAG: carbohydrate kinase [Verrucomicrobia bacterium]|nr:carbohydrate kinase [Verrucomicrobiota bacterium]
MTPQRLQEITGRYPQLTLGIVGDFCLDRYFDIDPAKSETSIETGLEVHNITRVRCQPGAAGTILNNLVALGVGTLIPVGMRGRDGEGYELHGALASQPGVRLESFVDSADIRTFTYTKPLVFEPGRAPRELNRLDIKNWNPTPAPLQTALAERVEALAGSCDGIILMDQVDRAETGVVTKRVLEAVGRVARKRPELPIVADSRRGLSGFPRVIFKMNHAELAVMTSLERSAGVEAIQKAAAQLAERNQRPVFVTLAEHGIVGADPSGESHHVASLPLRGEIDIVGAGDAVTANLTAALAAGATLQESMVLAMCAASVVIHQLGTTGTASPAQIAERLASCL